MRERYDRKGDLEISRKYGMKFFPRRFHLRENQVRNFVLFYRSERKGL